MGSCKEEIISVRGRNVKLLRGGEGAALMFLHDAFCPAWLPLHDRLASEYEVFVPIHLVSPARTTASSSSRRWKTW